MEGQEKNTFTAEELETAKQEALNKYKSDQEKWIQKIIEEKKFAEKVLDAVGLVAQDQNNLVELYDESPDVAEEILNKYYGWQSIDEYKESIGFQESEIVLNEKMIERKAKSIVEAEKIKDTKKAFIEKTGLKGEELEAFESEFEERMQLKSFSINNLDDNLTKAYKLATGYSEEQIKDIQKSKMVASVSSVSGTSKQKDSETSRIHKEVNDLLEGRI